MSQRDEVREEYVELADVLDNAADLLETRGWMQGASINKAGEMCATGAIARAISPAIFNWDGDIRVPPGWNAELYSDAIHTLESGLAGKWRGGLVAWNDHPGRQAHEVIDLMKHTAKDLRNRAGA